MIEVRQSADTTETAGDTPLLRMRRISKSFPGVKALDNAQLTVNAGEVHAVMGENGAGKSTLIKILAGAYSADPGGEILINGEAVSIDTPAAAIAQGIAVIYQELSVSPNLTVAENIYLGREIRKGILADRRAMQTRCADILKNLGATFTPQTTASSLSLAEQQLVEIARAVHTNARILVMDEPSAALASHESERLLKLIEQLRESGLAIIYVSHRIPEIAQLADRVTVLRDGAYVGTIRREEFTAERLVKMMVGRDLAGFYKKARKPGPVELKPFFFEVKGIRDDRRLRGCSFGLRHGEILGVAGLMGSGRTEMARLIFGADPASGGEVILDGTKLKIGSPRDAIRSGIVYLTEDRKGQGLFLDMSVHDNINSIVFPTDARLAGVVDFAKSKRAQCAGAGRRPVGRQPAEGVDLAPPAAQSARHHPRRADPRRRYRREVGNLPDHGRPRPGRHWDRLHFLGAAGNHRYRRPHPRHARGADRRGV
jgi:ribose transport system ATP-binding protein